jgi:hypothetical protein
MGELIPCEHCEQPIARNAVRCPHCGGISTTITKLQFGGIFVAVVIAIGLAAYLALTLRSEPAAPPAPEPARLAPAQPAR